MIPTVTVSADKNPDYTTNPGKSTQDQVFLLSIMEAERYFSSDEARKCAPTDYAIAQGAWTSDDASVGGKATCWWWLRSPGSHYMITASVSYVGTFYSFGYYIDRDKVAVRPAMWITIAA